MNWKTTVLISLIILLVGAGITYLIFNTEPTAQRSGATKKTAMLVDVTTVERDTFTPQIQVMGTVEPSQEITLSPRISGEVLRRAPEFTPGGIVQEGKLLLQIDPADYQNALQQRQSELSQAISELNIEMGRQDVARRDYQLIGDTLSDENKALVLRKPQLESVRARVEAARSAVDQAELQLERTKIRAPFDAHILSRNVNVGSQVSPGNNLGQLVGMDEYWVVATVPLAQLRRLQFPDGHQEKGSKVKIKNRTAWQQDQYREGYLYKLVGALEDETRMARVLITVPDPLAYESDDEGAPSLMIGSYVEANIQAEPFSDVVRINRDYIRQNKTVWIMEDGKLRIRDVDVVFRDAQYAYITDGLSEGDRIVTTNLTTVVDGSRLRTEEEMKRSSQDTMTNK